MPSMPYCHNKKLPYVLQRMSPRGNEKTMNKYTDELLEAVDTIATLIYYQADISEQDKWLQDLMDKNIWKPSGVEDE